MDENSNSVEPKDNDVINIESDVVVSDDQAQNEEIGGFKGPEPTRYGDWEKNGRCIDF